MFCFFKATTFQTTRRELLWTSISSERKKPLQLQLYRPSQNQQELSIFILPASRDESQILIFIFHNFFFFFYETTEILCETNRFLSLGIT